MRNIYFVGYRASGKTTLAKALAEQFGHSFVDTDELFVKAQGSEIADYVEAKGWESFRTAETEVLKNISQREGMIVSCGGGIVLSHENRHILKNGFVIYLQVDARTIIERLEQDPLESQRPSLTGKGLLEEVQDILVEREPLYNVSADVVLDGTLPVDVLAGCLAVAIGDSLLGAEPKKTCSTGCQCGVNG